MDDIQQIQTNELGDFTINLVNKDDNDFGNLAAALQDNAFVKRLSVTGGGYYSKVTIVGWKAIFVMLQINKTIQSLDIGELNFRSEYSHLFADMVLSNCNTLQELRFHSCMSNGWDDVSAMVAALCTNPNGCTLQSLTFDAEMTSTNVNIDLIKQVAGMFVTLLQQKGTVLKKLNLSSNWLEDEFMTVFADGLKKGTQLEILHLSDNYIQEQGAKALGSALYFNTTLVELKIDCNGIGDEGADAIATALRYHPTLQKLDLHNNNMSEDGPAKASKILHYNEVLQTFEVDLFEPEWDPAPILAILDYNDTLHHSECMVEFAAFLVQNRNGERTAPKKGVRRRQNIYTWFENDWIYQYKNTANEEALSTIIEGDIKE